MQYSEHIFFIFNTAALHFYTGYKEMALYFFLDNMPVLLGLPFLILGFRKLYLDNKERCRLDKLSHIK